MKLGKWAYPSTVTVEPYLGEGGHGPIYGTAVEVSCAVDDTRRVVRAPDGAQVVSETTLLMPPDVDVPAESRVTVAERTTTAITSGMSDAPLGGMRQRTVALA